MARLHKQFLSRQLGAIFVALKLQLQNRTCKPGAIFSAICRRDIVGVSTTLARQKLHRVAATKIACVNGPLALVHTYADILICNFFSPDTASFHTHPANPGVFKSAL